VALLSHRFALGELMIISSSDLPSLGVLVLALILVVSSIEVTESLRRSCRTRYRTDWARCGEESVRDLLLVWARAVISLLVVTGFSVVARSVLGSRVVRWWERNARGIISRAIGNSSARVIFIEIAGAVA